MIYGLYKAQLYLLLYKLSNANKKSIFRIFKMIKVNIIGLVIKFS